MPNLHPIFVHFSVGLLIIGFVFLLLGLWNSSLKEKLTFAGLLNLWTGVLITLGTVATGLLAYYNVPHNPSDLHEMTEHRNWAIGAVAVFVLLFVWSIYAFRKKETPSKIFLLLYAVAIVLLTIAGEDGGELVYEHGVGVQAVHHQNTPNIEKN